jgi:hypothetical protein
VAQKQSRPRRPKKPKKLTPSARRAAARKRATAAKRLRAQRLTAARKAIKHGRGPASIRVIGHTGLRRPKVTHRVSGGGHASVRPRTASGGWRNQLRRAKGAGGGGRWVRRGD